MLHRLSKIPIIKRIHKSWHSQSASGSIFRNMAVLASGSMVARVITIASTPIITRIYLPEHMGVLSVFVALSALLVPFGTLRYSSAIPLPKRDGIALNVAMLCAVSLLSVACIITLAFALIAPSFLRALSMEQLLPYWWLLPVAVTGTGLYEILQNWAIRTKSFKIITKTRMSQAIIGSSTKIILGFFGLKPLGLLIGQIFQQAGGTLSFIKSFRRTFALNSRWLTKNNLRFVAARYVEFPKYRLPSQFLLVLATKAPLFYFAWQFGKETTGQLGLALSMLALPMTLFGQSTAQAYFAEIAKIGKKQPIQIQNISKSIVKKLALVSLPPFLILLFAGPIIFSIAFGPQWRSSGVFASILSFYLVAQFVSSPLVNVLTVFDKQSLFVSINCVRIAGICAVLSASYLMNFTANTTLIMYSIILALHYLFTSILIFRIMHNFKKNKLRSKYE
jgi:O-antigen/teichoic acid export membrane protein